MFKLLVKKMITILSWNILLKWAYVNVELNNFQV